ncbi:MAG: hypothetical protein SH809_10710 [Rhodothermales bacterium]|nr:hypothetical protein [Rhodothermales bacterium]
MNSTSSPHSSRVGWLVAVLFLACLAPARAQFVERMERFTPPDGAPLEVHYLAVPDSASLGDLQRRLPPANYPLVVVKQAVFASGIAIVRDLEEQKSLYALRDLEWQRVDSIQVVKLAKLEEIIGLQEMRVDAHASANAQLIEQIDYLNEQLDRSVELTEKSLRGRQVRNLYIGILGGAVGFSLASLIALVN